MPLFHFTEAVKQVACPRCKSAAGTTCVTPKGKRVDPPHAQRVWELQHQPSYNPDDYRIAAMSGDSLREVLGL